MRIINQLIKSNPTANRTSLKTNDVIVNHENPQKKQGGVFLSKYYVV